MLTAAQVKEVVSTSLIKALEQDAEDNAGQSKNNDAMTPLKTSQDVSRLPLAAFLYLPKKHGIAKGCASPVLSSILARFLLFLKAMWQVAGQYSAERRASKNLTSIVYICLDQLQLHEIWPLPNKVKSCGLVELTVLHILSSKDDRRCVKSIFVKMMRFYQHAARRAAFSLRWVSVNFRLGMSQHVAISCKSAIFDHDPPFSFEG